MGIQSTRHAAGGMTPPRPFLRAGPKLFLSGPSLFYSFIIFVVAFGLIVNHFFDQ
jgi:hypothetical protein